ncbi:MAG: hypothetical protein CYG60_07090 [Actinobacteria bacterium]|nr:MAG: hypothetical protein CYG60_07090 [Actinomycetota bacterium]
MSPGSFFAGVEALEENVGEGLLEGKVVVDQHYALDQHENFNYEHPRGGGPKYLINPLLEHVPAYVENLGEAVLGGNLVQAMAANMEDLSSHLDPAAPIDEDPNPIRLRRSGNPIVIDNGTEAYNRPPVDPREPFEGNPDEYDSDGFRTGQSY